MNKKVLFISTSVVLSLGLSIFLQNSNETDEQSQKFTSNFTKDEKKHLPHLAKAEKNTIASKVVSKTTNKSKYNKQTTDVYQNFRKDNITIADANEANKVLSQMYIPTHRKDESFVFNKAKYGSNGSIYYGFQQTYKGLKVYGAEIAVQVSKTNKLEAIIGKYSTTLSLDTTAAIIGSKALDTTLAFISDGDKNNQKIYEEPNLIVYMDYNDVAHLAYESVVKYTDASGTHHTDKLFIDANSADLIDSIDRIHTERDIDIYTLNGNCISMGSSGLPGQLARDNDTPIGTQSVDNAYDYLNDSYYFYKHMFNRFSYDTNDATIIATVDAKFRNNGQCSGLNAFFSPDDKQLAFGTGDSSTKNFAGAADIVGHELTHAVTWKTSNLEYKNESGALNESISDIFGTTIQAWVASGGGADGNPSSLETNDQTWILGEQLENESFERYLNNPSKDGRSPDNYDDRKTDSSDNGGVHSNSGITNLSYALLVEGGTHPKNKTDVVVPGIGMEKAIRIWYEAQTTTISTRTDYDNIRASLANAATSLYDECSPEYKAVQLSMDAVKMPGTWECPDPDTTAPEITSITPDDSASDVSITTTPKVTFNEPMDIDTINTSNITLTDSNSENVAGSLSMNGNVVTFTPQTDLAYTSTYTFSITSGVTDTSGNALEQTKSISFTTANKPDNSDNIAPTISSVTPTDGSTDVEKDSIISVDFSENIDADSLSSSFTLNTQSGNSVNGLVSVNGSKATFTPTKDLIASTNYVATISTGAKDLAGNNLLDAKSWSFSTVADSIDGSVSLKNATLSASSRYNMSYDIQNISDGILSTEWVSQTNFYGWYQVEWIRIDLDKSSDVKQFSVEWNGYYYPEEMNLWALIDGKQVLLKSLQKYNPGKTTFSINRSNVESIHLEMRGGHYGSWFVIKEVTLD